MKDEKWTTLSVKESTKERIEKEKVHPNQSYDEILNMLLDKLGPAEILFGDKKI